MYHVYQNQGQGPITLRVTSLDMFYNLPFMKIFHTFLKNCKGYKVETWYTHGQWVDVSCILESGQGSITHGVKSLDRFYVAMLPCPTVMLSGKHEFKIFQHCGFFFSDSVAVGLLSDPLTALV